MEYTKNCPNCGKIQKYNKKYLLKRAIENNTFCIKCRNLKTYPQKTEEEMQKQINKRKKYLQEYRKIYDKNPINIEKRRKREKNKSKNPLFRINKSISGGIYRSLKNQNLSKNNRHWEDLVGYTVQELKDHIESKFQDEMSWSNYGEWHIDHIIPKSFFKFSSTNDVEFKYCWSLDNLQPLWEKDNLTKSNKII